MIHKGFLWKHKTATNIELYITSESKEFIKHSTMPVDYTSKGVEFSLRT
jgi:hypothetical protein